MLTAPIIITWIAGGVVGTLAGILTRKVWKKATHTEAAVAQLQSQLDDQTPPNKGQSL